MLGDYTRAVHSLRAFKDREAAASATSQSTPAASDDSDSPSLLDISNYTPKPGSNSRATTPLPGGETAATAEPTAAEARGKEPPPPAPPTEDDEGDFMCSGELAGSSGRGVRRM